MANTDRIAREAVEINVSQHCNLRCSYCDHVSPLLPEKFVSKEGLRRDLTRLAEVMELQELRFVGGEPLLNPELVELLRMARAVGIAKRIVLVSNGVLLDRAPEEIWECIDRLWISRYPGVALKVRPEELERRAAAAGVELWLKESPAFRLTLLNQPISKAHQVREIYRTCELTHSWSCHALYEGRYYKCSPAPLTEARLALMGVTFENKTEDGVPLHDNPRLREDLVAYLRSTVPLRACTYCLGSRGPHVPVRQLNRAGLNAWLKEDHSNIPDQIDLAAAVTTDGTGILPSHPPVSKPPWHGDG